MAVVELYIDHTGGSDPGPEPGSGGDGTIGNPWRTLGVGFTNIPTTSAVIRYNVKNTSSGSKMTSLGSLPSGRAISTQVIVQPYSSAAGDTDSLLYIDCGGGSGWTQPNDDAITFNRCHFSNSGSTFAFDLDNNIGLYRTVFDSTYPESDNAMQAWFCSFINQTGDTFKSGGNSGMYHCLVTGSGEATGAPITCANLVGNVIYWAGSRDHLARGNTASNLVINNSWIYDNAVHATGDGYGYRTDDQSWVAFNYWESCARAIDSENNSEAIIRAPNAFYNNTVNRYTVGSSRVDLALPLAAADYDLAASGMPNVGSGNVTLSNELADLRTNQYTPFAGTSTAYEAYFGAPFKSKSGGGTSGKQGLHAIESGSV
jgi:hypothetical protein